jgi:DNA-binding CsgD family transcriptional regulator
LNISTHTVHTHIKNIYEKLQAKGRADAVAKARKKGII